MCVGVWEDCYADRDICIYGDGGGGALDMFKLVTPQSETHWHREWGHELKPRGANIAMEFQVKCLVQSLHVPMYE